MNSDCEHIVIFSTGAHPREDEPFAWPVTAVASCGEALRHIALTQPTAIVVLAKGDDGAAELIRALRLRRPQLPVVALAQEHHDNLEREMRVAGATAYVTRSDANAESLIRAASTKHLASPVEVSIHSGCSPPARSRGQPRPAGAE